MEFASLSSIKVEYSVVLSMFISVPVRRIEGITSIHAHVLDVFCLSLCFLLSLLTTKKHTIDTGFVGESKHSWYNDLGGSQSLSGQCLLGHVHVFVRNL